MERESQDNSTGGSGGGTGSLTKEVMVTLQWFPLLVAVLISLIVGAIVGVAWAIVGFLFFAAAEETAEALYGSPLGAIGGFVAGLLPIVTGAVYLCNAVDRRRYEHCAIFGGINILISFAMVPFFPDEPTTGVDIIYWLVAVPVALATCWASDRLSR